MVNNIQFLRAVACLLVIFAHIELGFFKQDVDAGFFSFGSIGVDLFFIISGYIMMLVSTKYNDVLFNFTDSAHFLKRRLLRVIPLNTFFIILSIAITYAFLNFGYTNNYAIYHFPETKLSIVYFLQSTFFLHFGMASINAIAWTLQYEAIFYFLFSMSIFLGIDRFKFFSAFSFLILSISLAGYNLSEFYQVILSPLHLEFFMGIIVFKLVHSEKRI
ncbi:TPA: acyltransferase family protein [Vibrio cholerae]